MSESLARELAQYNVSVFIVQPGAFRTNFLAAFKEPKGSKPERYTAAKEVLDKFEQWQGKQPGDAEKAAARMVEAITGKGMAGRLKGQVLRMPLGPDCVKRYEAKLEKMGKDLEISREVSMSTNVDE
jgi:NAD(P)-dependent dehydrogenase (short-subunit alcohol dehydrogenase family)